VSLSPRRRTGRDQIDTLLRSWRVAALAALLLAAPAQAQTLKTVRLSGGEVRSSDGRPSRITGGYVDPRTGRGRVEHRGGVLRLGRNVRRVRTSGLVTRVVTRRGHRLRLRLAQLLFARGTTTFAVDPGLNVTVAGGTFRVVGGRLDARTLAGTLGHTGALTLSRGERTITFFDLGLAVPVATAQMWDFRAPLATLAGVERTVSGRSATVRASATLTEIAARELGEAFETEEFREGMPLGTLTVSGRLRG
jgi:hypothetical protein